MDRPREVQRASRGSGGRSPEPDRDRRARKREPWIAPRRWPPPATARSPGASPGWRDWLGWDRGEGRRDAGPVPAREEARRILARRRLPGSNRPARRAPRAPCTRPDAARAPGVPARAALRTRTGRPSPPPSCSEGSEPSLSPALECGLRGRSPGSRLDGSSLGLIRVGTAESHLQVVPG